VSCGPCGARAYAVRMNRRGIAAGRRSAWRSGLAAGVMCLARAAVCWAGQDAQPAPGSDAGAGNDWRGKIAEITRLAEEMETALDGVAADGTDLSVLLGVRTPEDVARVRDAARLMVERAEAVTKLIAEVIEEADRDASRSAAPQSARNEAEELQLVEAIRRGEAQVPLRRARAAVMLAATAESADLRARLAEQARLGAESVDVPSPWAEAQRGSILGLAALFSGAPKSAEDARKHFDAAREAATAADAPPGVWMDIGAEVLLGRVEATRQEKGPVAARAELKQVLVQAPFTMEGEPDPLMALAATDAMFRLAWEEAAGLTDFRARSAAMGKALGLYAELVERRDLAPWRNALLVRAMDKLGVQDIGSVAPEDVPLLASVARADRMASKGEAGGRGPAIEMVESAAARPIARPAAKWQLAEALWWLGQRYSESRDAGELRLAAARLTTFVEQFPDDERAGRALALACASAQAAAPDSGAEDEVCEWREWYLGVLRLVDRGTTPMEEMDARGLGRDHWRLELARQLAASRDWTNRSDALARTREACAVLQSLSDSRQDAPETHEVMVDLWDGIVNSMWEEPRAWEGLDVTPREAGERLVEASDRRAECARRMAVQADSARSERFWRMTELASRAHRAKGLLALERLHEARGAVQSVMSEVEALGPAGDEETRKHEAAVAARVERELALVLIRLEEFEPAAKHLERFTELDRAGAGETVRRLEALAWAPLAEHVGGFAPEPGRKGDVALGEALAGAPVLRLAMEWMRRHEPTRATETGLRAARALLLAGRGGEAVPILAEIEAAQRSAGGASADVLRDLGEAQIAGGDDAGAFATFRSLVAGLESQRAYTREYWHAWARILEILQRQNGDGSRTALIRREIGRLRLLESFDACPACADRIETVAEKVGMEPG